jgi:hypothetical protein
MIAWAKAFQKMERVGNFLPNQVPDHGSFTVTFPREARLSRRSREIDIEGCRGVQASSCWCR